MEGIIYKWTNKINNKVYIGKTTKIDDNQINNKQDGEAIQEF